MLSACRCDQTEYNVSEELQTRISSKQVRCPEEGCGFRLTLAEYLLHGHGKAAYSNAHVDFNCLKQRLVGSPSASESSTQAVMSTSIRSQLLQVTTSKSCPFLLREMSQEIYGQAEDEFLFVIFRYPSCCRGNVYASLADVPQSAAKPSTTLVYSVIILSVTS